MEKWVSPQHHKEKNKLNLMREKNIILFTVAYVGVMDTLLTQRQK